MIDTASLSIRLDANLEFPNVCPWRDEITRRLTFANPAVESARQFSRNPERALRRIDPVLRYYEEDIAAGTISVPIGMKDTLFSYCQRCSYGCRVQDDRTLGTRPPERRTSVNPITLRPSQQAAYAAAVQTIGRGGTGLIQMPTGCGKTITGFHIANEARANSLFITHTIDLAEQTADSYERIYGVRPGFIGDGRYELDPHFTVAIIDSIYAKKRYEEWNDLFGMVFIDESHRVPTKKSYEALTQLRAKYKIGLTATPNRSDGLGELLIKALGSVVYRITIEQAMAEGSLVPLRIETRNTEWMCTMSERSIRTATGFKIAVREASMDERRNRLIVEIVEEKIDQGHCSILVLNSLEQCQVLYEMMVRSSSLRPAIFTGEQSRDERKRIVGDARTGAVNALLTVQLAGMGLDIPRATHLLMDRKVADPLVIEQITGRVVRACPEIGKRFALVTDLYDQYFRPFANQTRRRISVYRKFVPSTEREIVRAYS